MTALSHLRSALSPRRSAACIAVAVGLAPLPGPAQGIAPARVIDDFSDVRDWTPHPSDGTTMRVSREVVAGRGGVMRVDFAFSGGGYAIVRKAVPLDFPANYELSFAIRGNALPQNLEVKLVDSTGDNVWWRNQRDFEFTSSWRRASIKKRQVEFAWGPLGGGELRRAAAIEIAITAGSGGRGTVWIDDLVLEERSAVSRTLTTPQASASSSATGSRAAFAIDGDTATVWRSAAPEQRSWLTLDFGGMRELSGLVIDWAPGAHAADYDVQSSADGSRWDTLYAMRGSDGFRDYLYLPETETRALRILVRRPAGGSGVGVLQATVQPLEWATTRNAFFAALARDAPRGDFPKYLSGEQSYWTITGVSGDEKEALINEQGMLEVDKSAFSIEPHLYVGGRLHTWADAQFTQELHDGYLPIPSVQWRSANLALGITAFAEGRPDSSRLWARYHVRNQSPAAQDVTLYLAIRPFQVNPPAQFLNTQGGTATIRELVYDGRVVRVTGDRRVGMKTLVPVTRPSAFGATTFGGGGVLRQMRRGVLPSSRRVSDSFGSASGALAYRLRLQPGDSTDVWIAVPLHGTGSAPPANIAADRANALGERRLAAVVRTWHEALDRVEIVMPRSAERFLTSLRANLGYMLVTRDGPALHPGARSYERAWIRDGAMMSAALLRMGHAREARAFAEWYAPFQYPNGKVPCCVDARGADPVPEHDSHGQLIYLIAEDYRYTRDRAFLQRMWPHVVKAVAYIDSLRRSRMTPEYQSSGKRAFYGMMPQSISHEGYSAKPMHSYWDDLFTLRGLKDAVEIATALGRNAERARFTTIRDEFRRDLTASYRRTMANHRIDYLPGSVELGDFDATSTTVGVTPGGEQDSLPHPALERTFERYYQNFRARIDSANWRDYTPYELRVVGTMVRLGWRDRAHELLEFFFPHQRPPGWRAWAEVVHRDPATTRFIGDLPHTWVGSDYIRSALDMLAYEREADSAIVIGAGVKPEWVTQDDGVRVSRLPTYHGRLAFTMRASGDDVRVTIDAERVPPGGFIVRSPLSRPIRSAALDGRPARLTTDGGVLVDRTRATLVITH